jgi:hypothetical protein
MGNLKSIHLYTVSISIQLEYKLQMKYSLSTIVPLLIISVILLQQEVYSATCVCLCCAGSGCTEAVQGTISVASCATNICVSPCQSMYPAACNSTNGSSDWACNPNSNNLAFHKSNTLIYLITGIIIVAKINIF